MQSIHLITDFMQENNHMGISSLIKEEQNSEYEGMSFNSGNTSYRSRLAKLTPKKKGYFVAFWEKDEHNINQAFSFDESPDNVIIVILDETKKGLFIFPKKVLLNKKILRTSSQKGKMAIRVYPSWESNLNPTATKTQQWQIPYFFDISTTQ